MAKAKFLLIHGWNYANYTSSGCTDAWSNRERFVKSLAQHFDVVLINLPGFCGQSDPDRPWKLEDYVDYVGSIIDRESPDCILGYSFGGAIALQWKRQNEFSSAKVFLVSPAILRSYKKADLSYLQKLLKAILPERLVSVLRNFYLVRVVRNPYYSKATRVMRETYRNIVAVDLRQDLLEIRSPLTIIYGTEDTATPSDPIRETLEWSQVRHNLHVIHGGGHDIANSHTEELVSLIVKEQGWFS